MDWRQLAKHLEDEHEREPKAHIQELAVLPLSNVVLLPGTVLSLNLLDDAHVKLVRTALLQEEDVVICYAPLGRDRDMMPSSLCGAGKQSLVNVTEDGCHQWIVEGDYRVEILEFISEPPKRALSISEQVAAITRARVRWVPDLSPEDDSFEHVYETLNRDAFLELVKRWLFLMGHIPMDYVQTLELFREAHQLADFITAYFLPDYSLKQKMLETRSRALRVQTITSILRKAVDWLSRAPIAAEHRSPLQIMH